ncbi:hypothetical protein ACGFNU_28520 [Spirillospora sp. NPDC048911]|uniref:hypothetical protein n=1 Tax=Spirillospora sp. NPDC048911 TaxID=3364527 RepID=UPI003711139D
MPVFDQEVRLERLLARHRDAAVVEPLTGRPALIRRDQILVAGHDAPAAEDLVRRWYDSRQEEHGVTRLRLRAPARVDVCELAAQLGGDGRHRRLTVSPNHLVQGQPLWWSGPADLPRPAPPLPRPEAGQGRVEQECVEQRRVTVAVLDTGLSPHPWYEETDWYAERLLIRSSELDLAA